MRLHLREYGEGIPLVCLHGVGDSGLEFRRLAGRLPGRRVLAPDLRGHGESEWEPPWRLEQHVEDVLATVGTKPRDWLGHSFGGRLCLEIANARPDLVRRLVLLDPVVRFPPAHALELAEQERTAPPHPFASPRPDRVLLPYAKAAVVAAFGELARPVEFPRVPTLLVVARDGSVTGRNRRRDYAEALGPLLREVVVPGGHGVLWDAFEETVAAVSEALRRPA
ncbi:MAG: alpha/beta fold hydrolase [Gaiellaceae bacterium]